MKRMKKILAMVTSLCILLTIIGTFPASAEGTNLLLNGSFEEVVDGSGWVKGANCSYLAGRHDGRKDLAAVDGDYYLQIAGDKNKYGVSQAVTVDAGKKYAVSFMFNVTLTNQQQASAMVNLSSNGKTNTSGLDFVTQSTYQYYLTDTAGAWKEFHTVFTPLPGSTKITLEIVSGNTTNFQSGSIIRVDAAKICAATDEDNFFFNGDMDSFGLTRSSTPAGYQKWKSTATEKGYSTTTFGTDAGTGVGGTNSLKVTSGSVNSTNGSYLGYGNVNATTSVEAGKLYELRASVRSDVPGEDLFGIRLYDSKVDKSSAGGENIVKTFDVSATYKTILIYYEASAAADALTWQLQVRQPDTTLYFDNISIKKVTNRKLVFTNENSELADKAEDATKIAAVLGSGETTSGKIIDAVYMVTDQGMMRLVSAKVMDAESDDTAHKVLTMDAEELPTGGAVYKRIAVLWDGIGTMRQIGMAAEA